MNSICILGVRGVPAAHGGFETFAEQLSLYLVDRGWRVTVYCQEEGVGSPLIDTWCGVRRVRIPVKQPGSAGSVLFDWKATRDAAKAGDLCLTLGYNTAIFCALLRWSGVPNVINMDGIEWRREKWGLLTKAWLWLNERAGARLGNHLIADHPEIALHLQRITTTSKMTMIPYGADDLMEQPDAPVRAFGLEPGRYLTVIARPEPENSLLEVVTGFSMQPRGIKLAVLGTYIEDNPYHHAVRRAASAEVVFLGSIYDKQKLRALRWHSLAYVHGHRVGGTNPSLVEALGAGNAVIAHDNRFNQWVAAGAARYFSDAASFSDTLAVLLDAPQTLDELRTHARRRFEERFRWGDVLAAYEQLLLKWLPKRGAPATPPR